MLKVTGLTISCSTATADGVIPLSSFESFTAVPTYTGCETLEGTEAKVTGFGHYGEAKSCFYRVYASGQVDLLCGAGAEVTVEAGSCVIHIPEQHNLNSVTFSDEATIYAKDINAEIDIAGIIGTHTDGEGCPFNGGGTFKNGTLVGESTITAWTQGQPSDISSESPTSTFTTGQDEVTLTANQKSQHTLAVTNQQITCNDLGFHGDSSSTTSPGSIRLAPRYTDCLFGPGISAKVTGFGHYGETKTCAYVLRASGRASLACDAGAEVTIDAASCTIHIPAQVGLSSISYANGTSSGVGDVTATFNITNLEGTHTDGFLCPFQGGGAFTNGTLKGESTISGEDPQSEQPVGVSWG